MRREERLKLERFEESAMIRPSASKTRQKDCF